MLPQEASWGIDPSCAPAYLLSQSVLGVGEGGNTGQWVSQGPTAPLAAPCAMGIRAVERDPLREKNSAEAAGNGFRAGSGLATCHISRVGAGELAQWPGSS